MLTKETKKRIDSARDILVGQLPLPSDQVELITIALIYKFMDDIDEESRSLGGKPTFFVGDLRDLNWRSLITNTLSADERVTQFIAGIEAVSTAKHIPDLFKSIFKNTFLKFRDGRILKLFLDEINGFAYDHSEELGNAFEYLLDTMGTQGDNGQFRTPRNIIEFIVDVVDPQKEDTILDPACGTAGFLISAYKHILESNTSPRVDDQPVRLGELLTGAQRKKLTENIIGYDITPLMARLSRVNMYLHHFANPVVHEYDTLTNAARWDEKFDCILANPPFMSPSGGVSTHNRFRIAANRTEVLFADYILEHLTPGGKAGFIVPEGIIFQNNDDYVALRKWLINEAGLWAVVSLPAQIFQPYSGVKTSVLLIDRALARTRNDVLLVKVENDGFSLNTNRNPIPENDLPAALKLLTTARRADYAAQLAALNSPVQHKLVPREDFAKLDAYKASSAAFDFCRKFRTRADKAEKALAEAGAAKNTEDAAKAEKSLASIRKEFPTATGLGALPDTLAELKTRFDATLKEPSIAFGADPKAEVSLTVSLKEHLDNQRDYSLALDRYVVAAARTSGCEVIAIGALCHRMQYGVSAPLKTDGEGYRTFRMNELVAGRAVDNGAMKRVPLSKTEFAKYKINKGDLLFNRTNSFEHVGRTGIFLLDGDYICASYLVRLELKRELVLPEYLNLFMNSGEFQRRIKRLASRAIGQANISASALAGYQIPLPPLEEQRAIVAELESYQRVVDGCQTVLDSYKPVLIVQEDWPRLQLGEFCRMIGGGRHGLSGKQFVTEGGFPAYGAGGLNGHLATFEFTESAVVLSSIGARCGKCFLPEGKWTSLANTQVIFPDVSVADLFFLWVQLNDEKRWPRSGTGQPFIKPSDVKSHVVVLPPLEEQQRLTAEWRKEQAALAGVAALKAKFESRITARLAVVWGAAPVPVVGAAAQESEPVNA